MVHIYMPRGLEGNCFNAIFKHFMIHILLQDAILEKMFCYTPDVYQLYVPNNNDVMRTVTHVMAHAQIE